ncbi:hypothetical protein LWI28_019447 [Acer negundo]|uniref:Uncharacterized protein n=1 Tax=Acer negundo TaxID=4023 RepID=A0AAD5P109_ACENE|nr:hypothetical protein LWI28_019447 [Acer negundo]
MWPHSITRPSKAAALHTLLSELAGLCMMLQGGTIDSRCRGFDGHKNSMFALNVIISHGKLVIIETVIVMEGKICGRVGLECNMIQLIDV